VASTLSERGSFSKQEYIHGRTGVVAGVGYFSTHPARDPSKRFQKIDSDYLHTPEMPARRKVVEAEAGSLVLEMPFDSCSDVEKK
jgi:hypothetical protein